MREIIGMTGDIPIDNEQMIKELEIVYKPMF